MLFWSRSGTILLLKLKNLKCILRTNKDLGLLVGFNSSLPQLVWDWKAMLLLLLSLDASNGRITDPTRTSLQHCVYQHSTTCFFLVDIAKDNCLQANLYSQAQVFICARTQGGTWLHSDGSKSSQGLSTIQGLLSESKYTARLSSSTDCKMPSKLMK